MGLFPKLVIFLHQNSYPLIPLDYKSFHYVVHPLNALLLNTYYTDPRICLTNTGLKFLHPKN